MVRSGVWFLVGVVCAWFCDDDSSITRSNQLLILINTLIFY